MHRAPSILSSSETIFQREQKAVKHIIATIFSAQDALRDLAPEQRWAGMGNLLGDYGEYIALSNYNLKKAPGGVDGYDAVTADGLKVQIKSEPFILNYRFPGRGGSALSVED